MNDLYLCTHYGFGDYVICYGLVKELSKKYDNIILFVIEHQSKLHIENIKRLFSSIKNVQINTDNPLSYKDVYYLGWQKFTSAVKKDPTIQFPKYFYDQVELPLELMWDNFYFERDIEKEKKIYNDLGLEGEEYIFVHDDPERGFVIDKKYLRDIRTIHLVEHKDISILDTLYLVEKASEVHLTTTGLVAFIDLMNVQHKNLNLHRYVRSSPFEQMILRLNWNII
jgi:hypothetical protein